MANLAIEPLKKYIQNIQNLSKDTLHELNLPISTIKTNIGMLKKNQQDEKILKRIKRIEMASDMLQQRYNELDYTIKTQTLIDLNEKFSLDELINKRVEFLSGIYPNIKFNLDINNTLIYSDQIGLGKVIDNIINNGVKYAPNSDKIDIVLKDYTLVIQDYGIGMDESELVKVFDNYYQSNTDIQGFGIGLSLVKRFCDKQDIKLRIESIPNQTTKIILNFKDIDGIK
ncbi:MAG: HAMP domain-containing histidine kinase [Sulfurimonas sp.]|nr:HAMP domain-containing histidine kinase [Sulfurimonas sp.]